MISKEDVKLLKEAFQKIADTEHEMSIEHADNCDFAEALESQTRAAMLEELSEEFEELLDGYVEIETEDDSS